MAWNRPGPDSGPGHLMFSVVCVYAWLHQEGYTELWLVGLWVPRLQQWRSCWENAGTSLSTLFPGVKPSLIFTPTGDRGPLAGSTWRALQLAVFSPCDHKPGGGRSSVLPLLLFLQPSTGSSSKQETFCPNKVQLVN